MWLARGEPYIRCAALHGFVETVQSFGGEPEAVLAEAGIRLQSLRDEETLVSWNRLGHALELAAARLGRDTFGLEWAVKMPAPYAGAGPVTLMALQSRTVGEWMQRVLGYWAYHTDAYRLRIAEDPAAPPVPADGGAGGHGPAQGRNLLAIRFDCDRFVVPGRQIMDYMIGGAFDIIRGIADPDDGMFVAARFRHMAPLALDCHREVFRCPLEFGADHYEIVVDRALLDLPIALSRERLSSLFGGFLHYQKQRLQDYDQSMAATVALAIPNLLGTGSCTLEFVSEALGVRAKKLQRLLAQENTAFSEVYNIVRRNMACRMLAETDVTFDKIAGLLDYTSAVAFANAFRRWHGLSPRAYRKRAREVAGRSDMPARRWWSGVSQPVRRQMQRRR